MNNSFSIVDKNAVREWKFARAQLIMEYSKTSAVPAPLNLLLLPFFPCKCAKWCKQRKALAVRDKSLECLVPYQQIFSRLKSKKYVCNLQIELL